jgi:ferredoxin-NADP reductase
MTDMRDSLTGAGVDSGNVHTELFGALPPSTPGISVPFNDCRHSLLELADACDVPSR